MAFLTGVSRFRRTDLIKTRSGRDTYGIISGFDGIKNVPDDQVTMYTVPSGYEGRAELIAAENYGDPHMEWVLVISNAVKNPLNWPRAGETIKIPRLTYVRGVL